jgi:N-acyl-phosphatidylethanolamine-hydrolysing phospholipase D
MERFMPAALAHCAQLAIVFVAFSASLAGAQAVDNPYYDPGKAHHTPQGFRNPVSGAMNKPLSDLLRWNWEAWREGLPPAPKTPTPRVEKPDLERLHAYARSDGQGTPVPVAVSTATTPQAAPTVTWIGHATLLVQSGGLNVLTDPIFSERASPVQFAGPKRAQPPGIALEDLPPIDVVVISHNHYDHLDRNSVVAIDAQARQRGASTLFLVPLGQKPWFESIGISHVVELDWWQKHVVRGVEFHLTPVQHWSARGLSDRSQTLWGGWSVLAADLHWYFGGDTGYSRDFADTRLHFANRHTAAQGGGFDLALIPIGAYEPRWFMREQHINPLEAVQVHIDLGAKHSIGMHWGTFALTDEPLDQPPKDLIAARQEKGVSDADFSLMKIGETRQLRARNP